MNQTTWVDLTDLLSWRGHFTGIQRVTYSIAKEYSVDSMTCFFYYDERQKLFRKIDFLLLEAKFSVPIPAPQNLDTSNSKKQQLKLLIHKYVPDTVLRNIPLAIEQRGIALVKKGLQLSQLINRPINESTIELPTYQEGFDTICFKAEDTVCILGAGWHKDGMIAALTTQKVETNFKLIHIIYDLIPIYFPQLFGPGLYEHYTRYLFDAIAISDRLIAISESTKRDTQQFCQETGLDEPLIDVIRLGEDFEITQTAERPNGLETLQKYVLCVGTIEIRKNHQLLYQTYRQAHLEGTKDLPKIVIVGRSGWLVQDLLYLIKNDPVVKADFIFLDSVSDAELKWLYQNCLFTIYPSVYEGWGLPIAESLSYGKLCLASNTSSMTEIAGNLIDYFSPYDPIECLKLIEKYSTDQKLLNLKEQTIRQDYEQTSWRSTFLQFRNFVQQGEKRDFLKLHFSEKNIESSVAEKKTNAPKICDAEYFRQHYDINESFLLYIGDIDHSNECEELFKYFTELCHRNSSFKKLVSIGKHKIPIPKHCDIISLGCVNEQTKWDALAACDLIVVPSLSERISMVSIEAWSLGKPVLVNSSYDVLVRQCRNSQGGLWYSNQEEFILAIEKMDKSVRCQLGLQGKNFIESNYVWSKVEGRYLEIRQDSVSIRTGILQADKLLAIDRNEDFLQAIYLEMLGRKPDDEGLNSYMKMLQKSYDREDVIASIMVSEEYLKISKAP